MTVKFDYKKHHFEYLLSCNTASEAYNKWPFTDLAPTLSSVTKRLSSVKTYGVERCLEGGYGGFTRGGKWTEDEEECLALAYSLCEGSEELSINLFRKIFPERSWKAVMIRLTVLQANGKITRGGNSAYNPVDYFEKLLSRGFMPVNGSVGHGKTYFEVECLEYGHKSKVRADANTGCRMCTQAGCMPLSQLKNHKLGKHPCIVYFIQFEDGVLKTGHTKRGIDRRSVKWPPFEIIKEIETTYYHARRIETETQNQCDRIPQYLPLQENGGTECFEEKHYKRILEILNKEEKDLLEHEKNSS
tara:strand:+ start:2337 stop:3242 length:906 start_codon:yes stop_codon:yes gene_type:complete